MIYLTQCIYLKPDGENAFLEFESKVLPLLAKYQGELILRLQTSNSIKIAGTIETPYEIHIVRFNSEKDLTSYSNDPIRLAALPLKEISVKKSLVYSTSHSQ